MPREHIVRSYDDELDQLRRKITILGNAALSQLTKAIDSLNRQDVILAAKIVEADMEINSLQGEVDALTVKVLATRQPLALDLRYVISGLKIAADLERIADYAANIAKLVIDIDQLSIEGPIELIGDMATHAQSMLTDIMDAYQSIDTAKAVKVWHRDDEIDRIYGEFLTILRELMVDDTENMRAYTKLLFVARCCERIGDHITNVAENVHFIEYGEEYCGGSDEK